MATFSTTTFSSDDANADQPDIYNIRYSCAMRLDSGNTLIGNSISQVEYYAVRSGTPSPSFTVYCKVWDSSDPDIANPIATSSTTFNSNSDIGTSPTLLTFAFDSSFTMASGYVIGLYGDNSASSTDTIAIAGRQRFPRTDNNVSGGEWNSTENWFFETNSNPQIRVTYASGPSSTGTRLPPPPLIARF